MSKQLQVPTLSNGGHHGHARILANRQIVVCRADGHFRSKVNPKKLSEKGGGQLIG
jgi:hypothetical protein